MPTKIRKSFQTAIEELQHTISYNDEMYGRTGDPNFAKFRDDNIRTLIELKEYILKRERQDGEDQLDIEDWLEENK